MNDSIGRTSSSSAGPFDTWAVLDFWLRRWHWVAGATVLCAIAGALLARYIWPPNYTAQAQMIHYAPSAVEDAYHPRDISAASLVVMLQSPNLFEQVGAMQNPPLTAKQLSRRLLVTLDRNNDVATVAADGATPEEAVTLVNQFTAASIAYTQGLQKEEASAASVSVAQQLKEVEAELASSRSAVPPESAATVAAIAGSSEPGTFSDLPIRLQAARDELNERLARYTDIHPSVVQQRAVVTNLEEQVRRANAEGGNTTSRAQPAPISAMPAIYGRVTPEEIAMGERLRTLEANRAIMIARQRALQQYMNQPPGYFRELMPATPSRTIENRNRLELLLCTMLGAFFGLALSAGQILLSEFTDNRVKTRADVRRVTGLPLLATLGDLKRLSQPEVEQWAFRAWTALQSNLSLTPNHGMVVGITSAHTGDGRSTWIKLLAGAASACGFRVLTITAQPSPAIAADLARREKSRPTKPVEPIDDATLALNANVLNSPSQIAEKLASSENAPAVNIPLPGWVWNLERRKQWQSALDVWREIENVVIFVELPPASVSETVLLAENVPNLIWLVDSNKSDAAETHTELETLRHARCNLVGAVLNRERAMPIRGRFSRWMGANAFALPLALALPFFTSPRAEAAEPVLSQPSPAVNAQNNAPLPTAAAPAPSSAPATFSVVAPAQRGAWQQKLTLGPGDVLSFYVFGSPELAREEVPIGPDGRISYLEAENVLAAGLTIDELRAKLDGELGKFRRAPQTYVVPVAFRSKKYYVLGNTVQKGVFPLDRPVTVIEAVARARGFESGGAVGSVADNTDFSRSFVSRGGRRLQVDLEKLFLQGDLSQNVALEPDDYLYFPTGAGGQVYVLGEVLSPGAASWDGGTSVISAIASRGGFTDRAWSKRVLVVRGSLEKPETFKVDVGGALTGSGSNVALKPGDLIFVSNRPWIRVEELLDRAATAFIESATITWTGIEVGPSSVSPANP